MMKKNEAAAKKQKKKEYQRLANLIDRALANDPRILRVKAVEKAAKAKAIQDKIDAKAAVEAKAKAEAEAQAEAETKALAAAKADSQAAKFAREQQKKKIRKGKKAFREVVSDMSLAMLDVEEIEFLCDNLSLDQLVKKDWKEDALLSVWTELRGQAYVEKKK